MSDGEESALPPRSVDRLRAWRDRVDRRLVTRLVKFGIVGASGVLVNVLAFELLFRLVLSDVSSVDVRLVSSNIGGIVVSIFTNFLLNDRWTWGDRSKGGRADWLRRLARYYVLASIAAGVQLGVTWVSFRLVWEHLGLVVRDYDLSPTFALFTGIVCGMFINFLASHLWAFRDVEEG